MFSSSWVLSASTSPFKEISIRDFSKNEEITTLPNFVNLVSRLGVEGPRSLQTFGLDTFHYYEIGEDGQFQVFRTTNFENKTNAVVVKRISRKFYRKIGKKQGQTRDSLRNLRLEIEVLAQDIVRTHPNLIKLTAWGYDFPRRITEESRDPDDRYPSGVSIPVLFVQEAQCSLDNFFSSSAFSKSTGSHWSIRYSLALGIAAGLQCLRSIGILHNDLKPENILVCAQENPDVPFISKLADFGLSVAEVNHFRQYGCTPGWRPPVTTGYEEEEHGEFSPDISYKSESFGYGLVALYAVCSGEDSHLDKSFPRGWGDSLKRRQNTMGLISAQKYFSDHDKQQSRPCSDKLESHFLPDVPTSRDYVSHTILQQDVPAYNDWLASFEHLSSPASTRTPTKKVGSLHSGVRFYRNLQPPILKELQASLSSDYPPEWLFGMAIGIVENKMGDYHTTARRLINMAATANPPSLASTGVVIQVNAAINPCEYTPRAFDEARSVDILYSAVSTGSFVAKRLLDLRAPDRVDRALEEFRSKGGFNYEMQRLHGSASF